MALAHSRHGAVAKHLQTLPVHLSSRVCELRSAAHTARYGGTQQRDRWLCSLDKGRPQLLEVVHSVAGDGDLALLQPALDRRVGQAEQPRRCAGRHFIRSL